MPQLLRGVLCVMDTFHKYAQEDAEEATLSCRELKGLVQREFGDTLQPCVIRAVERNLNLPNMDSDGTIGFDEFVLTIFHLVSLSSLDISALLNSEPEEKPADTDVQAASRTGQWTEGPPPTQGKAGLPSGAESSAQHSPEGRGHSRVDPQGDAKAHKVPGNASGRSDPKNQHLEGDEQEVTQDVSATGDEGAQIETKKPKVGPEQTGHPTEGEEQDESITQGKDRPVREQRGAETRGQFGDLGGNLGTQTSPSEEMTLRAAEELEAAAERGMQERPDTQEQPLPGGDEPSAEPADRPAQTAAQKPTHPDHHGPAAMAQEAKSSAAPEHAGRTSETQEPPAGEKDHETKNLSAQGDSEHVPETPDAGTEKEEGGGREAQETGGQEARAGKTRPPALEDKAQGGKDQDVQEPAKEGDAEAGSKTPPSSSEGDENHPEREGVVTPGEDSRLAEEDVAEAPVSTCEESYQPTGFQIPSA